MSVRARKTQSAFALVVEPMLVERGWNHSRLAREAHVSVAEVSRWFSGHRQVKPQHVDKLASALGVSVASLAKSLDLPTQPSVASVARIDRRRLDAELRAQTAEANLHGAVAEACALHQAIKALHQRIAALESENTILRARLSARETETT